MVEIKLPEELRGLPVPINIIVEHRPSARISLGDRKIIIRLPKLMTNLQKQKAIEELLAWAKDTIARKQLYAKKSVDKYSHGSQIHLLGTPYEVQHEWVNGSRMKLHLTHDQVLKLWLPISVREKDSERREAIRRLLVNGLSTWFHPIIQKRVLDLNRLHFNADVSRISLRYTVSRWGSCSSSGSISLSTKLLLTPPEVCDYVIIHELAHRFEMNHSLRFWNLVEKAMPEYKQHRQWLKTYGRQVDF